MIEQLSNPDASVADLKGQKGKSVKGGLFAKFLAAFQKQVQKGANAVPSAVQSTVQISNKHSKPSGTEELLFKKEQVLAKGVKSSIPFQINKGESGEVMKEAFFASLNGEKNISISNEESGEDVDSSALVTGLGITQAEHAPLISKNEKFGEQAANGKGEKEKNNLFTSNQKNSSQTNFQNKFNGAEDVDISIKEKVISGNLLKGHSEKSSAALSSVLATAAAIEKGTEVKTASLPVSMFGAELQKQASELTGKPQHISTPERSALLSAAKGDLSDGIQLKTETATPKEIKLSHQANTNSHAAVATEGELDDGPRVGEQRIQNVSQRGQSSLGDGQSKVALENVARQSDQADVPVNPLIQNSKARATTQAQQAQFAQVTGAERMASQTGGQSLGGFQQDSSSSQQPEALLADASKADMKGARGADFSAHMNYKTAQAYKPAEVMLEIARSAKDGAMKLELQLEPAHLGRVQITLQSDAAKQLQIHIAVDQSVSRQMLEQHLPQLRMALAQQGLDLGHFSMGMSSQGGEDGSSETGHNPFSEFTNLNGVQGDEQDGSSVRLGINTAGNGRISILA